MTTKFKLSLGAILVSSTLALSGCKSSNTNTALSEKDAEAFLAQSAQTLVDLNARASRAAWIYANFITEDTASLSADVNREYTDIVVRLANEAAKFDALNLSEDNRRKMDKLKLALTLPAPQNAEK